jgi:hypothetical protein
VATLCYFEVTFKELEKKRCVECWMIQLSPSQEIGNLKPKTQKPQTKTQLDWVVLKEPPHTKKKKTTKVIFMFCESWVFFWEEPL